MIVRVLRAIFLTTAIWAVTTGFVYLMREQLRINWTQSALLGAGTTMVIFGLSLHSTARARTENQWMKVLTEGQHKET